MRSFESLVEGEDLVFDMVDSFDLYIQSYMYMLWRGGYFSGGISAELHHLWMKQTFFIENP